MFSLGILNKYHKFYAERDRLLLTQFCPLFLESYLYTLQSVLVQIADDSTNYVVLHRGNKIYVAGDSFYSLG